MASRVSQLSVTGLLVTEAPVRVSQLSVSVLYSISPPSSPIQVSQLSVTYLARKVKGERVLEMTPPIPFSYPYKVG